ncbi:MAG TPA: acetate--CoA ligase family protein [Polyangiales bacterium]|nr:acetate--CoA ligase family protein [Polyangiales bacterium]
MTWRILCESPDLAVQCLSIAKLLPLQVSAEVESAPCQAALASDPGAAIAVVLLSTPELATLVELAAAQRGRGQLLVLALPVPSPQRARLIDAAAELGLCVVNELRPLCALLCLLEHGGVDAELAAGRSLAAGDRARLRSALADKPASRGGHLFSLADGRIGWSENADGNREPPRSAGDRQSSEGSRPSGASLPVALGEVPDVGEALLALRRRERPRNQLLSSVDDVDARSVLDIIFGPRRALSDPTSKAALAPYGIPLPVEELCGSPSRAAAEAARIGYPVRISLASPELRVWDHPDLCLDMVDNAASVRDGFRQLMAAAHQRLGIAPGVEDRRVLGVMITATSDASALLGVRATPLPQARVAMRIGFADPHGRAADDSTISILPAEPSAIERSLQRLAGSSLLLDAPPELRKARVDGIADVLLRLSAFVHDRRQEIEAVELRPLAVLLDGSVEVREACVSVSDHFERALPDPALTRSPRA